MNFVLSSSLIVSVLAFSVSLAPFQEDQQTQPPNELAQQNDAPKTFRTQNEPLPFSVQIEKDPDKREIKQQILFPACRLAPILLRLLMSTTAIPWLR